MREAIIVCRLTSRRGKAFGDLLLEELPKRGVLIAHMYLVRKRKELRSAICDAVKSQAEVVVVVSGDGAQSAAVGELACSKSALAVVPAGTGNSFAYTLGVRNFEGAVEAIVNGRIIHVDVGEVNGTRFANFATVGFLGDAAKQTPRRLKRFFGPVAYLLAALPFFRAEPFRLRVEWKNRKLELLTHQAIVANGRYFGYQAVTPDADLRSGKLAFFAAAGNSVDDVLKTNLAILLGEQTELPSAHCITAKRMTITTTPRQALNVDGHPSGKTPAKFRALPKALRVIVPADFPE